MKPPLRRTRGLVTNQSAQFRSPWNRVGALVSADGNGFVLTLVSSTCNLLIVPDARIEERERNIGQEVDEDEDGGDHQHDCLYYRIVTHADRCQEV